MTNSAKQQEPEPATKFCSKCRFEYPAELEKCPEDGSALRDLQKDPLVGKIFADRYQILSVLGYGGMSMVYKARHTLMDRIVAIKVLHSDCINDPLALQRFQLESKAAASLTHPNVVTVYDFGVADGQAFFVMDCLEGKSLAQVLEQQGPLSPSRMVSIFRQVCDGLAAAHRSGIIHRDLKPGNLILMPQDNGVELVKIVDFGIAKMLPREGEHAQRLTQTGEVFGSPVFMSPEQCLGKELDVRSDIYSLGCVMYEALADEPPLIGESFLETLNKHVGEKPKQFAKLVPKRDVPPQLEEVIFKCLEKDPAKRFQSVDELRDALPAFGPVAGGSSGSGGGHNTLTKTLPRQMVTIQLKTDSKLLSWVSGVALLLLFTIICFLFFYPGPPDDAGSPANKLLWQVAMSAADSADAKQDYAAATNYVNYAIHLAENFGDRKARLLASLNLDGKILRGAQQFDALRTVNDRINAISLERVRSDFARVMTYLDGLTTSRDALKNSLDAVDIQASVDRVFRVSGELEGNDLFADQEKLLEKARQVLETLHVQDLRSRAKLDSMLATCLIRRQRLDQVRALLVEANELYAKDKLNSSSEEAVRALLTLAVFDKDQSDYSAAKLELDQTIAQAKKLGLQKLLGAAYGAYSDYYHQLKQEDLAKVYAGYADKLL